MSCSLLMFLINHINVIYVVKDLVWIVTYRDILEHIQVINLINVIYVVKDLVRKAYPSPHLKIFSLLSVLHWSKIWCSVELFVSCDCFLQSFKSFIIHLFFNRTRTEKIFKCGEGYTLDKRRLPTADESFDKHLTTSDLFQNCLHSD
jgi:hypothetical protein